MLQLAWFPDVADLSFNSAPVPVVTKTCDSGADGGETTYLCHKTDRTSYSVL